MKINILSNCVGCGACAIINPEVFDIHKNCAIIHPENIEKTEDLCIDAALNCPANAIIISDY